MISIACAAVGLIVGSLNMTGTGIKFVGSLVSLGKTGGFGEMFLVPFAVMIVCIILGMGLPVTASYVIVVSMASPALIRLGFPIIAVHMFVLYYATLSAITPPVALSAYAAASIAGASSNAIGLQACALALIGFLVPFIFLFSQELLLIREELIQRELPTYKGGDERNFLYLPPTYPAGFTVETELD